MSLSERIAAYRPYNSQEKADQVLILEQMEKYDDLLFRENKVMHFTASAWVVTPKFDHVLMIYHNIYNSWSWTGGHADGEEDLLSVAIREVREETGLVSICPVIPEIYSLEILGVPAHFKRGSFVSTHLHLNLTYLMKADPNEPLKIKYDENSAVRWIPAANAVSCSSEPQMKVVYRKLMDKLSDFYEL